MGITRRQFLGVTASALASGAGIGLYTWRIEPHWVEEVRRPLPISNLPSTLEGGTLVQVSDLHVGPRVDSDYLIRALHRVATLAPDIVTYTGDFITYHDRSQLEELDRVLGHAPRGFVATVGILGNHDYGRAWRDEQVAAEVVRRATNAGITVLRNTALDLRGLQIAGLDDLWGPRFGPQETLGSLSPSAAHLILCHNPDALDQPVWGGYQGWVLAGHTHGGQCKPPFLPPPVLPVRNPRYTAGEIPLDDGRRLYINRGLGHLLRVRFNVRPEVTIFTLTREG
jgi:predicted MPP superfamily phosphohydrolase